MSVYRNPEHFNIGGDDIVEVTVRFDVSRKAGDPVVMRNAADYLNFVANNEVHKSWGRDITIKRTSKED